MDKIELTGRESWQLQVRHKFDYQWFMLLAITQKLIFV
jgi:hypothetical protein